MGDSWGGQARRGRSGSTTRHADRSRRPDPAGPTSGRRADRVLDLQRQAGNRAVSGLLADVRLEDCEPTRAEQAAPSEVVAAMDPAAEAQADSVADRVADSFPAGPSAAGGTGPAH